MMTVLAPSSHGSGSLSASAPGSSSSSPASPTGAFAAAQQSSFNKLPSLGHLRSSSRPESPMQPSHVSPLHFRGASDSPPPHLYHSSSYAQLQATANSYSHAPSSSSSSTASTSPFGELVSKWTDGQVASWLSSIRCGGHAQTFAAHDIRGDVLLELDQATLREMGITSIGDRIRILNAVKALRVRIHEMPPPRTGPSINGSTMLDHRSPKLTLNGSDNVEFPRTGAETSSSTQGNPHHGRLRGRPAPLNLRNATKDDLPRVIPDLIPPPDSARSATPHRQLALPNQSQMQQGIQTPSTATPSSQGSQVGMQMHHSSSSTSRANLPPLPPPPRSQPPLPPAGARPAPRIASLANQHQQQSTGRRTPTQSDMPHYSSQVSSQSYSQQQSSTQQHHVSGSVTPSVSNWKTDREYGLPSGPRPGNVGSNSNVSSTNPPRATSPMQNSSGRNGASRSGASGQHSKTSSISAMFGGRSQASSGAPSSHPYATAGATSSSNGNLQAPAQSLNHNLSPIAESFLNQSAGTNSTSGIQQQAANAANQVNPITSHYQVGRGPFGRPTTPSHSAALSLDDLRRRLIKFMLPEDGHSVTINVAECQDGVQVLEKALKKFGKFGFRADGLDNASYDIDSDVDGLSIDGWAVYLDWGQDDGPAKALNEAELLSVCSADLDHPVREHGLTIRRVNKPKRSKALQAIFGEQPSSPSPRSPITNTPKAGSSTVGEEDDLHLAPPQFDPNKPLPNTGDPRNNPKRASSISVLSGLGVRDPERILETAGSSTVKDTQMPSAKSPSSTTFAGKMRAFLGQRPPSELIATHLPAYFPYTQPKVLRRTIRQSVRFSTLAKRDSTASAMSQLGPRSRFSSSTIGSHQRVSMSPSRASMASMASLPPPPVPDKTPVLDLQDTGSQEEGAHGSGSDAQSIASSVDSSKPPETAKPTHLLPPVNFPTESFSESLGIVTGARSGASPSMSRTGSTASHRISYISELRARRDRSDTASMLTVDEITAEVENRRQSTMTSSIRSVDSEAGHVSLAGGEETDEPEDLAKPEIDVSTEEVEEVDEEGFDEDEEEEEGVEEEDEEPVVSDGKRKWIRGALIGAGSFGSVYLGMDAMTGLLMAVKQVELPTGSGANEERKKSMLSALEREIDLLKELQHDNIVQYLESFTDDKHLNIFLEYVPGGSVTALLRSYGAFEETLCRHFVRQILTGLNYLHEREIIHRDIKGANILVDNKSNIKISDFGISKKVEDTVLGGRVHRPSLQGSVFWMAPEVVKQTQYTRKADIWSVGCLIVEMLTGEHPWAQLNQMQAIFKIGSFKAKPTIPSDISPECEDFLQRTFEIDHNSRPTASELLQHAWLAKSFAKASSGKVKVPKSS